MNHKALVHVAGRHFVSPDGGVFIQTKSGLIAARPQKTDRGYLRIAIKGKNHKVHRLVALAFVPNPDGLPHVNHIDGNKENNSAENLEWVSDRQNKEHAKRCGLLHTVALVAEKHGAGYWFPSIVSVRAAGFTPDGAWDAYSGRCKTHRGYKFFKA